MTRDLSRDCASRTWTEDGAGCSGAEARFALCGRSLVTFCCVANQYTQLDRIAAPGADRYPAMRKSMESSVQTQVTTGHPTSRVRILARLMLAIALVGGVGLLLLTLAGVFQAKIPTGKAASLPNVSGRPPSLAEVRSVRRPRYETVVGTVRSTYQSAVASKLLAKVLEVKVKAGQAVTRGEILVRLEGAELDARRKQAEAAVAAARLEKDKAGRDYERTQSLLPSGGISKEDFDHRETARRTTAADLDRAEQVLAEAKVFLEFATIRAPDDRHRGRQTSRIRRHRQPRRSPAHAVRPRAHADGCHGARVAGAAPGGRRQSPRAARSLEL